MHPLIVIILLIGIGVVMSSSSPAPHTPPVFVIQAMPEEPAANGWGCMPWIIIGLVGMFLLWATQIG
jgi:uncharacterized protein YceK